jgi:hypothetical protein
MWLGTLLVGGLLFVAGPVRADDAKDRKEMLALVDKAVKAAGGEAKLKKFKLLSFHAKATMTENNMQMTLDMDGSMQGFDKVRMDMTADVMGRSESAILVINGDKAWAKHQNKIEKAPEEMVSPIKNYFHALRLAQRLTPLKDKAYTLSSLGEVKVDDRPAVGVKAKRKGYTEVDIFFDKKTHLPVKCQVLIKERKDKAEVLHEFVFSEAKKIGGVQLFTKVAIHRDGKKLVEMELSTLKAEDKLDKKLFDKPE